MSKGTVAAALPRMERRDGQSLSDHIAEVIKGALSSGSLRPGTKISADGVARALDISHIPVREALNKLTVDGHVDWIANRGYFVPQITLGGAEDVYHWRRVIEDEASRLAVPRLTDQDIGDLEQLMAGMQKAVAGDDLVTFHRVNREFHFLPVRRYCSDRVVRLLDSLWDAATHYQSVLIRDDSRVPYLQTQHEDLMAAFAARDADKVNEVMLEHRHSTLDLMRQVLADEGVADSTEVTGP